MMFIGEIDMKKLESKKTILKKIELILIKATVFFSKNKMDFEVKDLLIDDIVTIKQSETIVKARGDMTSAYRKTLINSIERAMFYLSLPKENIFQVTKNEYNDYRKIEFLHYQSKNELYKEQKLPDFKEKLAKNIAKNNIEFDELNKSIINKIDLKDNAMTLKQFDRLLFHSLKDGEVRRALYVRHKEIKNYILYTLFNHFHSLTKHDTYIDPSTLTESELKQALNTSITKFMEQYYQQPKQLLQIVRNVNSDETLSQPLEAIKWQISNSDDINMIKNLFREYKRDMKGRVYNYSLFTFIYYDFAIKVSGIYIYNSPLLKKLNLYDKEDRKVPVIKKTSIKVLNNFKETTKMIDEDIETIFLDNIIDFLKHYIHKKYNYYSIAYLMENLHNSFKDSKDFIERLECKDYKNVKKDMLPQPINTLLLPPQE